MFEGLFLFLVGVLGFVFAVLACACMLFSVKFHVGMREVWMLVLVVFGCGDGGLRWVFVWQGAVMCGIAGELAVWCLSLVLCGLGLLSVRICGCCMCGRMIFG